MARSRSAAKRSRKRAARLAFRPVTPGRWKDLEALFGERGACGGCWCMAWRLRHREFQAGKGAANRRALKRIVESGGRPGVLAYDGPTPVGWCSVGPREEFAFLARSRVLKPLDDRAVWSITCLFVAKGRRRRGLGARLLRAAADLAARRGARLVEGYPTESRQKLPDAFVWTGTPGAFRRAGFREVLRRSPSRPIFRKVVRGSAPLGVRQRAGEPGVRGARSAGVRKRDGGFPARDGRVADRSPSTS
jgi:GNAT superfamily N-acetyltransferase